MNRARLLPALGACWGVLVVVNYAASHPLAAGEYVRLVGAPLVSLDVKTLPAAAGRAAAAAGFLLVVLGAAAWSGGRVLGWTARVAAGDSWVFSPLLGLGAIAAAALGTGLVGLLNPWLYAILLVPPALLALRRWRRAFAAARLGVPPDGETPGVPKALLAVAVAGAVLVQAASLVSGLTPPHISDELVVHLGLARWYLRHHAIVPEPGNVFAAFPHMDCLLYAAGEAAGLGGGVKWLHWAAGWLALAGFARLIEGAAPGLRRLALLAAATMPIIWTFAGRAFSDLFLVACGAAAVLAARRRRAVLAGLIVGLAGACKYTGLLIALLVLPLLPGRGLLPAAAAAAAVAGPWLARNACLFGDPVHPFLWGVFRDSGWDEALARRFRHEGWQGEFSFRDLVARVPALPWLLPVRGLGAGVDGSTGILLALGIPLLLTACRPREAVGLLAFALPNAVSAAGIRFLLPALPLAGAVIVRGADRVPAGPGVRRAALAVGALLVAWQAAEFVPGTWRGYDEPLPVVLGTERDDRYLDRMRYPRVYYPFPATWPDRAAAERTPPDARILFIGGFGGAYGVPRWCVFTPLQGRPIPVGITREARDAGEIAKRFRQLGLTHVLVNRWLGEVYLDYWRFWDWGPPGTVDRWIAFWDRHAIPVAAHGRHLELFALSREPRRGPHRLTPGFESEVVRLGVVLLNRRRPDDAARLLADVAPTFPGNAELWMALGMARAAQGRMADARECARRAAALAPGSPADLRVRAALAAADGRLREAARLLAPAALRLDDDPYAWLDLSILGWRLRDPALVRWAEHEYRRTRDYVNVR